MADEKEKPLPKTARQMTSAEVTAILGREIPLRFIRTRKAGNRDVPYLHWMVALKLFTYLIGDWSKEIKSITQFGDKVAITVRVTIHCKDGDIFREATAQEEEDLDTYGDTMTNAEAQATKRAFANFGFASELYLEPEEVVKRLRHGNNPPSNPPSNTGNRSNNPPSQQRSNPPSNTSKPNSGSSNANIATEKQVNYFLKLLDVKGQDMADMALQFSGDRTEYYDQLTGKEMSNAIDWLTQQPDA